MTILETLGALASLPDDAQVTITIRKADLVTALEQRAGGPATLTTTQAAKHLGYTGERWRRWAVEGVIAGAYQSAKDGPWHLPRASCEEHLRSLARRGARVPSRRRGASPDLAVVRSVPRGPWKSRATSAAGPKPAANRIAGTKPVTRAAGASAE